MNWLQLIERRTSVRQYEPALDEATTAQVRNICEHIETLNSGALNLRLLPGDEVHKAIQGFLGWYGRVLSPWYIAVISSRDRESLENAGYYTERAILEMTALNLGTCWIGGLFDKKAVNAILNSQEREVIALIACGRPKKATWSKAVKAAGRLGKRLAPERLAVFESAGNSSRPWWAVLEAVRWAPSAINRQPWRLWFSANEVHLFCESRSLRRSYAPLEMGIALCHLELACSQLAIPGNLAKVPHPDRKGWEYWTSFSGT